MTTLSQTALSMTSLQIAELVESRHDDVKRSIERLANQSIIVQPPLADEHKPDVMGRQRTTRVYIFSGEQGKRDSIIVVAQLSPEFTARLVDRWQELEQAVALGAFSIPQTYTEALRLAADLSEENTKVKSELQLAAPKVEVHDRIADDSGTYLVRRAAKVLGTGPRHFVTWLLNHKWAYRHASKGHLLAYQDKLERGWLAHKLTPYWNHRTQMNEVGAALRVTSLGLTELAKVVPTLPDSDLA